MNAAVGVSRPQQIGGEGTTPAWAARDCGFVLHSHGSHRPHQGSEDESERCDVSTIADCPLCSLSNSVRRYPEHFCGWERCCYKFPDEGALLAKDFQHLPVCHIQCWTLERDRLGQKATLISTWPRAVRGLPMCHRQCYMKALAKVQDPDAEEMEIVPRNRSLAERLRISAIEHKIGRTSSLWLHWL